MCNATGCALSLISIQGKLYLHNSDERVSVVITCKWYKVGLLRTEIVCCY